MKTKKSFLHFIGYPTTTLQSSFPIANSSSCTTTSLLSAIKTFGSNIAQQFTKERERESKLILIREKNSMEILNKLKAKYFQDSIISHMICQRSSCDYIIPRFYYKSAY